MTTSELPLATDLISLLQRLSAEKQLAHSAASRGQRYLITPSVRSVFRTNPLEGEGAYRDGRTLEFGTASGGTVLLRLPTNRNDEAEALAPGTLVTEVATFISWDATKRCATFSVREAPSIRRPALEAVRETARHVKAPAVRKDLELVFELPSEDIRSAPSNVKAPEAVFGGAALTAQTRAVSSYDASEHPLPEDLRALAIEAEEEDEPRRCAALLTQVGLALYDRLDDAVGAVDYLNQALDVSPADTSPFGHIERILRGSEDWRALDHSYRQMLKRWVVHKLEAPKLHRQLWSSLAELHEDHLGSIDKAIAAYTTLARLDAGEYRVRLKLGHLHANQGQHEEAKARWQQVIGLEPTCEEAYHELFSACMQTDDYDGAWCVANALTLVQQADETEAAHYQRYALPKLKLVQAALTAEQHGLLRHADLDARVSDVVASFIPLRTVFCVDLKKGWRLHKRKGRIDLTSSETNPARILSYAMRVLRTPELGAYLKKDDPGRSIHNANTEQPAIVLGAGLIADQDERELTFVLSKALYLMRPELYLTSALVLDRLEQLVAAALFVIGHSATQPSDALLRSIQDNPPIANTIQTAARRLVEDEVTPDLRTLLMAADYTTDRVGLLMRGDLHPTIRAIRSSKAISGLDGTGRIRELLKFSVSSNYLQLRKELGLAITS